jgi:hypothetical protein
MRNSTVIDERDGVSKLVGSGAGSLLFRIR